MESHVFWTSRRAHRWYKDEYASRLQRFEDWMKSVVRQQASTRKRIVILHATMGALVGMLVLHPGTMAIYWFEFHPDVTDGATFWYHLGHRIGLAFTPEMLPMAALFALIGGILGLGVGVSYHAFLGRERMLRYLTGELTQDIPTLIRAGENERIEFKASARWDVRRGTISRAIEEAVVKTIAGLLNHQGGSLFIGVADDGRVIGLERDYGSLRRKDRDGFEQFIVQLARNRLGGDICSYIHLAFREMEGKEICRILVEPSPRPVYCEDGHVARYFLRTGNATHELDAREALDHVKRRWHHR